MYATRSGAARLALPLTAAPGALVRFGGATGGRVRHLVVVGLLWFPALVLTAMSVLMLVRGLGYGFVIDDQGWVNAWGGPSLAGAWVVHALVGVFGTGVAVLAMLGLAAMVERVERRYLGDGGPLWPIPVAVVTAVLAVLFLLAWVRQI
ncbi:hypothetical protein [Nocardia sp. NPDC048505]|uniref:hypothetical protein n=1 Tax=unclassified Nocardia TaxID=2637762 RepID=UPI0033E0E200